MPNALMTQKGTTEHGGIVLDKVSNFNFGYLTLFGVWKLGFRISSHRKSTESLLKNGDF
jgi:hypothetical protein